MRYRISTLAFLLWSPLVLAQSDATEIMRKVDERYTGDSSNSNATLVLIDKKDRQRLRELTLFSLDNAEVDKSIIFFRSPADVKNTAYMAFDWKDESREDDTWLYLPALQKVQRVAASDESGSFMGSDFSYADINGLDFGDFTYTLEKESDPVEGADCWVIKSVARNEDVVKETGYTESLSWVRKDAFMTVKAVIEVKKGKRTKYFVASDIEKIDGIWTAQTLQMVTTRRGEREHSSVFKIRDIKYNQDVDATMFDTQAMQRGI